MSRYVHLNPVRIGRLGLSKSDRARRAAGDATRPSPEIVAERIAQLRGYRWSSYPAYSGLGAKPAWLECEAILELAGDSKGPRARQYREYVESAVREGLEQSPWEDLREQGVLGGEAFLEQARRPVKGDAREQRGAKRLGASLAQVIARVEQAKGEDWERFRERYGDTGRDLVLSLRRRECGLTLRELAQGTGLAGYKAAASALQRYESRLKGSKTERALLKRATARHNEE